MSEDNFPKTFPSVFALLSNLEFQTDMHLRRTSTIALLLVLLVGLLAAGCDSKQASTASADNEPSTTPAPSTFPRLQAEQMQVLLDSVDYIDYVFYELTFSMSMDNASGIQYALAQVGPEPARRSAACQPIGRVFYQIKGRNAMAADMFFSKGCTYFEFIEDNKVIAANEMSEVGKEFLNNQFGQIIENYQPVE